MMQSPQWRWQQWLGISGLYLLALFGWLGTAGANIGLGLLVLGFIADRRAWQALRREPIFWWVVLILVYWLCLTAWGHHILPANREARQEALGDWFYLTLFIPVAWWLNGDLHRLNHIWLLAAAGLMIGMLLFLADPANVQSLLSGERSGFHLKRPIAFGLYSGTVLLGLLVLAPRFWFYQTMFSRWRFLLWLITVFLLAQGLLLTHSRGTWLAAILVMPLILVARYRNWFTVQKLRMYWRPLLLAVGVLGTMIWLNMATIANRLQQEPETVNAITAGNLAAAPASPISYRLRLWDFAIEKWQERPLLGWGPGNSEYLIVNSGRPEIHSEHIEYLDHLHNTYLELLIGFGLCGTLLAVGLLLLLWNALRRAARDEHLPEDYVIFLVGAFGFMGIWMFFDFRSLHPDWRFYWLMLAGATYTFYLNRRLEADHSSTSW